MNYLTKLSKGLVALCVAASLVGCGGSGGETSNPLSTGVYKTVLISSTEQCTAKADPSRINSNEAKSAGGFVFIEKTDERLSFNGFGLAQLVDGLDERDAGVGVKVNNGYQYTYSEGLIEYTDENGVTQSYEVKTTKTITQLSASKLVIDQQRDELNFFDGVAEPTRCSGASKATLERVADDFEDFKAQLASIAQPLALDEEVALNTNVDYQELWFKVSIPEGNALPLVIDVDDTALIDDMVDYYDIANNSLLSYGYGDVFPAGDYYITVGLDQREDDTPMTGSISLKLAPVVLN